MPDFYLLIAKWYRQNSRDLPWRLTNDPYKIWLSEIILQQTRVDQGKPYYEKFITAYPNVEALANSSEEGILNLWQGLGYYSRARNLHAAAKQIITEFRGEFPTSHEAVLSLKGVGNYTAAAIMSFAYNEPYGVVDGNVYRVLSRVFDIDTEIDTSLGKKEFQNLANELISSAISPSEHNQAIMELGALVCKPSNPLCSECPLSSKCLSLKNSTISERPRKRKKQKVRERIFHFFVILNDSGMTYIQKRHDKDIWQHLYQFPLVENENKQLSTSWIEALDSADSYSVTHLLSHQRIKATFYRLSKFPDELIIDDYKEIHSDEIGNYPLPRLIDRYLENHPIS